MAYIGTVWLCLGVVEHCWFVWLCRESEPNLWHFWVTRRTMELFTQYQVLTMSAVALIDMSWQLLVIYSNVWQLHHMLFTKQCCYLTFLSPEMCQHNCAVERQPIVGFYAEAHCCHQPHWQPGFNLSCHTVNHIVHSEQYSRCVQWQNLKVLVRTVWVYTLFLWWFYCATLFLHSVLQCMLHVPIWTSSIYLLCPGLDYVGHEDVLPYKTTQKQPIFNHLFDKFLVASDTSAGTVATAFSVLTVCGHTYTPRHLGEFVLLCCRGGMASHSELMNSWIGELTACAELQVSGCVWKVQPLAYARFGSHTFRCICKVQVGTARLHCWIGQLYIISLYCVLSAE